MFRLVHTADWQIGMMACGLGPAASKVRAARFSAIENVLALAADRRADAIVIAGDVFADNQVSTVLAERLVGLLADRTRIATFVLPGNHDPYSRDSIYHRPLWQQLPPHVKLLTTPEPISLVAGVTLYPCPILSRNGSDDPTACIPPRRPEDGLRIGLAHGTMRIRPDVGDDHFPIPMDVAQRRELDYLALGHFHSTLADGGGRAWYSGTHETTRFGERDSGNALVVNFDSPGRTPAVQSVRVGTLTWMDHVIDLDRQSLDDALNDLRRWPDADHSLLRITLTGETSAGAAEQIRAVVEGRFLYSNCDDSGVRVGAESILSAVRASPYLARAAATLATLADGAGEQSAIAHRALQLLHRAAWESQPRNEAKE